MENKNNKEGMTKFVWGLVGILALGLIVWAGAFYFAPEARDQRAVMGYLADLEEQYRTDTYGGETPEETLALFIAALENGDVEEASKYFLPDDRTEILNDLEAAQQGGGLREAIKRFKDMNTSKRDGDVAFFTLANTQNVVEYQVTLVKNPNNVWKIMDL